MKKLWLLLLLGTVIMYCKPEGSGENGADSATANSSAIKNIGDGYSAAPVPLEESPLVTTLTSDYWVFEFYVIPGDQQAGWANQGRWYDFNLDGTFESGHWEELTGNGSWRMETREGKQFIIIDSTVDEEDAEWEIKVGGDGQAMSWVGTENYKRSSHMLKAISLLTRPTKKQFGVE